MVGSISALLIWSNCWIVIFYLFVCLFLMQSIYRYSQYQCNLLSVKDYVEMLRNSQYMFAQEGISKNLYIINLFLLFFTVKFCWFFFNYAVEVYSETKPFHFGESEFQSLLKKTADIKKQFQEGKLIQLLKKIRLDYTK